MDHSGADLRLFIETLAHTVHDKLGGLQEGLAQSRDLVHDAVVKLGESFHSLHAQTCEQEALMQTLSHDILAQSSLATLRAVLHASTVDMQAALEAKGQINTLLAELDSMQQRITERLGEVANLTAQIGSNVGLAVRALQFEDLMAQLVDYMHRQLNRHAHVFTALQACLDETASCGAASGTPPCPTLSDLTAHVLQLREHWDAEEHKPVQQVSMSAGDIELF